MRTVAIVRCCVNITMPFVRVILLSYVNHPCYTQCCKSGDVILPFPLRPPVVLSDLYDVPAFRQNIRAYNIMFAMTSLGAEIDEDINGGGDPYVFKVTSHVSCFQLLYY
uniref:Uncharacterized protein n=1 Tax=Lactuca sativa TaxID=4236 RepID=A0A9R1XUN2_LACSA|nr:hypothetical protein LSAT_V11C100024330 [Lactuca sativa]